MNNWFGGFVLNASNLADQAVIIPLAFAIAVLFFVQWRQGAVGWVVGVGGTIGTVVAMKFVGYIIGYALLQGWVRSPSAHAAAGAVVYGGILALLIDGGVMRLKTVFVTSLLIGIFFSLTRIELGVHTRIEVVVGSAIGVLGAITMAWICGLNTGKVNPMSLAVITVLVVGTFHGVVTRGEFVIRDVSYVISNKIKQTLF